MDSGTRTRHYLAQTGGHRLTPAQRRRVNHKANCRKTHVHVPERACSVCLPVPLHGWQDEVSQFRPYKKSWLESVPVVRGRGNGKSSVPRA